MPKCRSGWHHCHSCHVFGLQQIVGQWEQECSILYEYRPGSGQGHTQKKQKTKTKTKTKKHLTIKNLLKPGLNRFLRVANLLASFGKRLATFVSTFLAALHLSFSEFVMDGGLERLHRFKGLQAATKRPIYLFIHDVDCLLRQGF